MYIKKRDFPTLKIKPEINLDDLPGFVWVGRDRECGFLYKNDGVTICSNSRTIEYDKLDKNSLAIIFDLCCKGLVQIV